MDRVVERGIRAVRRLVVGVVGSTLVLVGILLIVLPGPAFLVIPIGLAILALEFDWARRLLRRAKDAWGPSDPSGPPASGGSRGPGARSD